MAEAAKLMAGKRGVVFGVANNRSIAWGIAKACHDAAAETALTWQGDAPMRRSVSIEQAGDSALCLLSDLSRGVTGEVHRRPRHLALQFGSEGIA